MASQYPVGGLALFEQPSSVSCDGTLHLMVDPPPTRYAKGPEGDIAYQVVGDGPMDLVVVPGWISHIDLQWDDPAPADFTSRNLRHLRG